MVLDPGGGHTEPVVPLSPDPESDVTVPLAVEDWLSVSIIAILALITFVNVIVRYLTSDSFAWTEEISVFLLIVLTMVGASSAFVRNQHIRIEFLADRGPDSRQYRMAVVANVLVLLFFVLLAVLSARMTWDDVVWGDTSPAIGIPNWLYSMWLPILAVAIALRVLGVLRRLMRSRS